MRSSALRRVEFEAFADSASTLKSTRAISEVGWSEQLAPIYAVAVAVVVGDGLANFHVTISVWLAFAVGALALGALLSARRSLGLAAAYVAIAIAANGTATRVLSPVRAADSIANMVDGSRVTIEGRVYRESEHEPYGDRIYVAVERATEEGAAPSAASGTVRVAVLGGGTFRIGDEIRLSARIHFPRNYGNPGGVRLCRVDGARRNRRDDDRAEQLARDGAI